MSRIEQKQPLPFAFYDDITKQNRYKSQCENYSDNEYLISSECKLLPFQIRGDILAAGFNIATLQITIVDVNTGVQTSIESFIDSSDLEVIEDADGNSYISYFGRKEITDGGDCVFENCVYYLIVNDSGGLIGTWYSELFQVYNVTNIPEPPPTPAPEETYLLKWNQADIIKHDSAADDLLENN